MLLNCKQCDKNINEWFLHYTVCVLSPLASKMALRTRRLAQMKVYFFPFVGRLMHRNAQNCYWMLIKIKKSLGNLIEHAIFRLSTQINAYFLLMNNKRFSWKNCDSPSSKFKLEREISWWQTHKLIILMITERLMITATRNLPRNWLRCYDLLLIPHGNFKPLIR